MIAWLIYGPSDDGLGSIPWTKERVRHASDWLDAQVPEGGVVRHAYRDHARELAELKAKRERIAASLGRA
jgi:hypothetical protein